MCVCECISTYICIYTWAKAARSKPQADLTAATRSEQLCRNCHSRSRWRTCGIPPTASTKRSGSSSTGRHVCSLASGAAAAAAGEGGGAAWALAAPDGWLQREAGVAVGMAAAAAAAAWIAAASDRTCETRVLHVRET